MLPCNDIGGCLYEDVKKENWEDTYNNIVQIITMEYKRHSELKDSPRIMDGDYYHQVISGQLNRSYFDSALFMLSKMLHEHHGIAPIIIIDEYDTPIQQGHICGFYDEVILFMRNMFSGGLKDNRYYITSNRESGEGRYDIALLPKREELPGILIELKADKDCTDLPALSKKALEQINIRKYDTEMRLKGVKKIFKYGVAFSGKKVEVEMEECKYD